jgi:hypothetical protein
MYKITTTQTSLPKEIKNRINKFLAPEDIYHLSQITPQKKEEILEYVTERHLKNLEKWQKTLNIGDWPTKLSRMLQIMKQLEATSTYNVRHQYVAVPGSSGINTFTLTIQNGTSAKKLKDMIKEHLRLDPNKRLRICIIEVISGKEETEKLKKLCAVNAAYAKTINGTQNNVDSLSLGNLQEYNDNPS